MNDDESHCYRQLSKPVGIGAERYGRERYHAAHACERNRGRSRREVKSEIASHVEQLVGRVQPALLNVKEAAVYLGRSEQSVQHLIFEKEVPVVRVGRRVHLDRRDLDCWIEKNKY